MPEAKQHILYISNDNNAQFKTVQSALCTAKQIRNQDKKSLITLHIAKGLYEEIIDIDIEHIVIEGESTKKCRISAHRDAKEKMPDGKQRGTFQTATVSINASSVTLKNLTIENTAGNGKDHGQCIALSVNGDKATVINCQIRANQDTLFTAPLPPCDKNGGFEGLGPQGREERKNNRQLFLQCTIEGNIDFIFGGATALFRSCHIVVKDDGQQRETSGYIAAPCTPMQTTYGYLFLDCTIEGKVKDYSVALARPWRVGAKAAFIGCTIQERLLTETVFDDWNKEEAHHHTFFAIDTPYPHQATWTYQLGTEEAHTYCSGFFHSFSKEFPQKWERDSILL